MKRNLRILSTFVLLFVGHVIYAQVSGTVTDANGKPVSAASVKVIETGIEEFTDNSGKFTIDAQNGQNLEVNAVGSETKKVAVTGNVVNFSLAKSKDENLTEVVAVGFRDKNKEEITGAVQTVDEKLVRNSLSSDVTKSLDGALAGVQIATGSGQPGAGADRIVIRGINSISASTNPLIIVDGSPYEAPLSTINNKDIDSYTVLKDASATSIYGNRAAGGVIVITTKRAKKGNIKIEFDARTAINKRFGREYDIIKDPKEYYSLWWNVLRNSAISTGSSSAAAGTTATNNLISSLGGYNNYNVGNNLLIDNNGVFNPNANLLYHDDWFEELFQTGVASDYYVNLSGGSDNLLTNFTVGYRDEKGIVINSKFQRLNTKLRMDFRAKEWFNVLASLSFTNQKTDAARTSTGYGNAFDFARSIAPIYPVYAYDANGIRINNANGDVVYDYGLANDGYLGTRTYGSFQNPVFTYKNNRDRTEGNYINANLTPTFKYKDFQFKYVLSAQVNFFNNRTLTSGEAGDAVNANGRASFEDEKEIVLNNQQLLSWKKTLWSKHNFDVMLGHETFNLKRENKDAEYENLLEADNPFLNNLGNFSYLNDGEIQYYLEGYFAEFLYNYDKKYYLNLSGRRDASSVFDPDSRWGNFYGASIAWRLSQENFMKDLSWVDELKLSAGIGTQGNDTVLYPSLTGAYGLPATSTRNYYAYQYQYDLNRSDTNGDGIPDTVVPTAAYLGGGRELTWEESKGLNIALDFELFKRLTGNLTYFEKKTNDLIFNVPFGANYNGTDFSGTKPTNLGALENKGFEVTLGYQILKSENLEWSVNLNATHYKNKITKLFGKFDGLYRGLDVGSNPIGVGHSRFEFAMPEYIGIDASTGLPMYNIYEEVLNSTGDIIGIGEIIGTTSNPNEATKVWTGKKTDPDVYGGFSTYFRVHNVDISMNFAYAIGGHALDAVYQGLMTFGENGQNYHRDALNSYSYGTNATSSIPVILNNNQALNTTSTRFLVKRDYLALNNLTIGYNLSSEWIKQIGLDSFRLYAAGENLFLFSKRQGYDPRRDFTGASSDSAYPYASTITFGMNIKF